MTAIGTKRDVNRIAFFQITQIGIKRGSITASDDTAIERRSILEVHKDFNSIDRVTRN